MTTPYTTGREEHPTAPMMNPMVEAELIRLGHAERVEGFYQLRKKAMMLEALDPFRYGYEPPVWKLADFHRAELRRLTPKGVIHEVNLGGNRASKTERAAKRIVQAMIAKPGCRVWCCDSTEAQSRTNQQRLLWKYFPAEWRNEETGKLKRTKTTKVIYTEAGGFSDNVFVLPNGSACSFKFYGMSVDDLEGPELDIVWADELVPYDWIETLVYRLVTRNGLLHVTFTPKKGFTPTVAAYLENAVTTEETEAELAPIRSENGREIVRYKKVPRIQFCRDAKARVIYFYTKDNPYGNYEAMVEELRGKPEATVLMRAYGYVTKQANAQFPMFKEAVHVISLNRFAEILKQRPDGPRYQLVDPCSGRNWFMLWIYFPWPRKAIVYREWPSYGHEKAYVPGIGDPGPWTVASTGKAWDGDRGPAQDSFGFGLERYKQEIERVEEGEKMTLRMIDSRYANAAKQDREGTTTLIEQMAGIGMPFAAMTAEKNILTADDGSIDMINSALYYDLNTEVGAFSGEMGRLNEPNLLLVETCPNTIDAMEKWTGKDGGHGACKDPVDCFDSETEILTSHGWNKFESLQKGLPVATLSGTGFLEFQEPTNYIAKKYKGEMIAAVGQGIDFSVTPNHRMLVYGQYPRRPNQAIRERLAREIKRQDTIPIASKGIMDVSVEPVVFAPTGITTDPGDWAEFFGWYLSEGSHSGANGGLFGNWSNKGMRWEISIAQSKSANPEKYHKIGALLRRMGFRVCAYDTIFKIRSKELYHLVYPLGNKYTKHVPRYVMDLPAPALERLWEALVLGDGWITGNGLKRYGSCSRRLVDDISELLHRIGRAQSNVHVRIPTSSSAGRRKIRSTHPLYSIGERKCRAASVTTKSKEMLVRSQDYDGMVYCVSVPNKTLLVRRNGKSMFCGNCLRGSFLSELEYVDDAMMTPKVHRHFQPR